MRSTTKIHALAKALDVLDGWLASGEGTMSRRQAATEAPVVSTDAALFRSAVLVTERAFQTQRVTTTPEARADITLAVYDLLRDGQADAGIERMVARMLQAIGGSTVTT